MRIIFMGTPDFAATILESLLSGGHEVICSVTQPDRPRGRSGAPAMSEVKQASLAAGIPVLQPRSLRRDPEVMARLEAMRPDAVVVAAFGQLLPKNILALPRYGCINVHASLLPAYRGSAPIQWAVINGDPVSGVTTMLMNEGMDTGDILEQLEVELSPDETGGSLFDRLAQAGGKLILSTLQKAEAGQLHPVRQDEALATHAPMLTKDMGEIDWSMPAAAIASRIRGLDPWPGAYTFLEGRMIKLWRTAATADRRGEMSDAGMRLSTNPAGAGEITEAVNETTEGAHERQAGEVVQVTRHGFRVQTGRGQLDILELQPAGKKRMSADAFLRGYPLKEGVIFTGKE